MFQGTTENSESQGTIRPAAARRKQNQAFRVHSHEHVESEERQREKEHNDVKVILFMLYIEIITDAIFTCYT